MSTERKPGSRGVTNTARGLNTKTDPANRFEQGPDQKPKAKGSTKTVSPSKGFKKKPRK